MAVILMQVKNNLVFVGCAITSLILLHPQYLHDYAALQEGMLASTGFGRSF
jgi:hypothetical protein